MKKYRFKTKISFITLYLTSEEVERSMYVKLKISLNVKCSDVHII